MNRGLLPAAIAGAHCLEVERLSSSSILFIPMAQWEYRKGRCMGFYATTVQPAADAPVHEAPSSWCLRYGETGAISRCQRIRDVAVFFLFFPPTSFFIGNTYVRIHTLVYSSGRSKCGPFYERFFLRSLGIGGAVTELSVDSGTVRNSRGILSYCYWWFTFF